MYTLCMYIYIFILNIVNNRLKNSAIIKVLHKHKNGANECSASNV